jgi:hypothetical protein
VVNIHEEFIISFLAFPPRQEFAAADVIQKSNDVAEGHGLKWKLHVGPMFSDDRARLGTHILSLLRPMPPINAAPVACAATSTGMACIAASRGRVGD